LPVVRKRLFFRCVIPNTNAAQRNERYGNQPSIDIAEQVDLQIGLSAASVWWFGMTGGIFSLMRSMGKQG
jgi:hypothetical protein